jgi:transcriptional regulator with XRE-family HTH domain
MTGTDVDVFMLIVSKKIRDKRKSLRISQQALSDTVGISRASVSNIERGNQSITIKHLVKVADALNCDISDLLPRMR